VFSYLYPVSLRKGLGSDTSFLELILFRNRLQLATKDVLYSDGDQYLPATVVCNHLNQFLPHAQHVLVLGTGLASMVQVLAKQGFRPQFTLVEKDKLILQWALEFLPDPVSGNIEPICEDAAGFMQRNTAKYDLIFIDIFNNRTVPAFVFELPFLTQCRDSLAPGGRLAFNYIVANEAEWEHVQHVFGTVFPEYKIVSRSINKILIA
jgi:spermidine synthase